MGNDCVAKRKKMYIIINKQVELQLLYEKTMAGRPLKETLRNCHRLKIDAALAATLCA
jgi:hypothetical protein